MCGFQSGFLITDDETVLLFPVPRGAPYAYSRPACRPTVGRAKSISLSTSQLFQLKIILTPTQQMWWRLILLPVNSVPYLGTELASF